MSKYMDLLMALDLLYRYYPRYHSTEVIILAEDILKWFNNELPEDGSVIIYLKHYFQSPQEALNAIWKEITLLAGPFFRIN